MSHKRIIAFVLYPGVTLLDAIGPYTALRAVPDVEVRFVSHKAGPIPDDSTQLFLSATHTFDETPIPQSSSSPAPESPRTRLSQTPR